MSCENIFKDVCHIHARLFDHRSAFQGHINLFAREFEEKRGDRDKMRLDHMRETVTQCTDHTLPGVQAFFDQDMSSICSRIQEATEACKVLAEKANEEEKPSEFLTTQRAARQGVLDKFMEQQCVRSARVDTHFEDNAKIIHTSFEELRQQLAEGVPFTTQTYYKFMALGKEFS